MPTAITASRSGPGNRGMEEGGLRPVDAPGHPVLERHLGPHRLEVEELLGVEVREPLGVPRLREVARGERRALRSVVPAAEGGDEHRAPERRTASRSGGGWRWGESTRGPCAGRAARRASAMAVKISGRQRHVDQHDPPGELVRPLDLADGHLAAEEHEDAQRRRELGAEPGRAGARARRAGSGSRCPRRRSSRTWTSRARSRSPNRAMSSPPECGPAAVTNAPVTTSAARNGTPRAPARRAGAGRRAPASPATSRAPTSATTTASAARREREQEVAHDDQRVQLRQDGDPAEHALQEDGQREPDRPPERGGGAGAGTRNAATPRRRASSAPTRTPTPRFENSTSGWKSFSGRNWSPQFGQSAQPSPEPVSRTVAPVTVTTRIARERRRARGPGRRAGRPAAGRAPAPCRPAPPSDDARPRSRPRPGRCARGRGPAPRTSPPAPRPGRPGARRAGPRPSAGRSRAPRPRRTPRTSRLRRPRSRGCGRRRRSGSPAPPPRARPSSAGSRSASSTSRTPLRSATSCAWPNRPKPVTSVTAPGRKRAQRVGGAVVQRGHPAGRGIGLAAGEHARPGGREDEAGAERLRQVERVARSGAALRPDRVRVDGARDRESVLGLGVADRVPPGEDRPGLGDLRRGGVEDRPHGLAGAAPPRRRRSRAPRAGGRPSRRRRSARWRLRSPRRGTGRRPAAGRSRP